MAALKAVVRAAVNRRAGDRCTARVADRWSRALRSVPDNSRSANATLLESVDSDSRLEERPV